MPERASLLLPFLAFLAILLALEPSLIFRPTTPAGGDLYAHLYPVWLMREDLIPSGRLSGWSFGWFAGFPAFYFYFPLPAVAAALLSSLLGLPVAIKVVAAAGLLMLPFVTYYAARSLSLSGPVAGAAAVAGAAFVFMSSFTVLGGNILSTLMGEYSYSWAFAGCILYLGLLFGSERRGSGHSILPGAVLAATALSHILGCVMAVGASIPLMATPFTRRRVLRSWILGFCLTGFWSVPFLFHQAYRGRVSWLSVRDIMDLLPVELLFWIPGALVGFLILRSRKSRGAQLFGMLVLLGVLAYFVPDLPFHNGRLLPYAFWSIHVLGGIAIGSLLEDAWKRSSRSTALGGLVLFLLVLSLFLLRSPAPVRQMVADHFGGTELKEGWRDFRAIMSRLSREPPGRVFSEDSESLAEIGTVYPFALAPYWTDGHLSSLAGLWQESALGNPFINRLKGSVSPSPIVPITRGHPGLLDFDLGVRQLQVYGVSYFVTATRAGAALANRHAALELLAKEGRFQAYRIRNSTLVEVAAFPPSVFTGEGLDSAFGRWFEEAELLPHWLVREGPPTWPRVQELPDPGRAVPYPGGPRAVWDVSFQKSRIAFRTQALGVPHLIKGSYFPDWHIEGGEGPFLAAPSLMVVIPRQEQVVLHFSRHWIEKAGLGLTWATLLLLGVSAVRRLRSSSSTSSAGS